MNRYVLYSDHEEFARPARRLEHIGRDDEMWQSMLCHGINSMRDPIARHYELTWSGVTTCTEYNRIYCIA